MFLFFWCILVYQTGMSKTNFTTSCHTWLCCSQEEPDERPWITGALQSIMSTVTHHVFISHSDNLKTFLILKCHIKMIYKIRLQQLEMGENFTHATVQIAHVCESYRLVSFFTIYSWKCFTIKALLRNEGFLSAEMLRRLLIWNGYRKCWVCINSVM